jgi:hypothetical protein
MHFVASFTVQLLQLQLSMARMAMVQYLEYCTSRGREALRDTMGGGSIGDAEDYVAKGKWYSNEKQMNERRAEAFSRPKGDDPLWCVTCRKRFGSKGVFDGHLTGKKHIGALKAAGKVTEAAAMKQRIVDQRNRAELSKAQEVATAKRTRPAQRDEHAERDKKIAKGCFEAGFQREGTAAKAAAAKAAAAAAFAAAAAAAETEAGEPGAAAAAEPAAPAAAPSVYSRPNPNGIEWWKGVPTTEEPEDDVNAHLSALERLQAKRAANRSGKDGPVRSNDWQCPGNYYTKKECGIWNYAGSQKCHNCGATRRSDNLSG